MTFRLMELLPVFMRTSPYSNEKAERIRNDESLMQGESCLPCQSG